MINRELIEKYKSSLAIVKSMLKNGIISKEEYKQADSYLAKKYCINKCSIYRSNDLINS